jgi:hypothetical protein
MSAIRHDDIDDKNAIPVHDEQEGVHHNPDLERMKDAYVADTDAADYVDPTLVLSKEEDRRLWKLVMTRWEFSCFLKQRVLPVMCVAYITQSLDKGALGPASIMGWQANVGAVGQDYALTSTYFYIGIIFGEPLVRFET